MDNREREALRELTEAARGFIDGKPKTLRRLRNATTEAERALAEARAAIEGESRDSKCQVPVRENSKALIEKWRTAKNLSSDPARAMTYGYCADELEGVVTGLMGLIKLMRESTHPDAMVREQLKAAANLMEEIVGGRAERVLEAAGLPEQRELTPDEQKNLRGVYDKLYRKVAAPQPVSEGRLREALERVMAVPITQKYEGELVAEVPAVDMLALREAAALESA